MELREMLKNALDLNDIDFKKLEHAFNLALNSEKCPCGSEKLFSECCKQEWQAAKRMRKNAVKEVREEKKEEAKKIKQAAQEPIIWMTKVGIDRKTGRTVVAPATQEAQHMFGQFDVAERLLNAYHSLMSQGIITIANQLSGGGDVVQPTRH